MRGLRLGSVLGVPVLLAPSWFLFAGFIVLSYGGLLAERLGPAQGYGAAAVHALLLLGSVVLHEIGHCVVARGYGLPVRAITITLLAGLTEITERPQTPRREFWVAFSGPLVSLVLGGALLLTAAVLPPGLTGFLVGGAGVINLAVAVFNLLPGLPLDGGRVLRAAVWRGTGDPHRATVVAARGGQVVAVASVPLALLWFGGRPALVPLLVVGAVAVFLWQGATAALRLAAAESRLQGLDPDRLVRRAVAVAPGTSVAALVEQVQRSGAAGAVVVDRYGQLHGVVVEAAVAAVPVERRGEVSAAAVARTLDDDDLLDGRLRGRALLEELVRRDRDVEVVRGPHGHWGVLLGSDVERVLGDEAVRR